MLTFRKILVITVVWAMQTKCCVYRGSSKNKLNAFIHGIRLRRTARFLLKHNCSIRTFSYMRQMQARSIERWDSATLLCRNLEDNFIPTVMCGKHCVDPLTCKKMDDYEVVPVLFGRSLTDRDGRTAQVHLPIACKCVLKRKVKVNSCLTC